MSLTIEYRLYYNDDGSILFYTTEKPEGKFIVITADEYAEANYEIIVKNNKIIKTKNTTFKMIKQDNGRYITHKHDVSIIMDKDTDYTQRWDIATYEIG